MTRAFVDAAAVDNDKAARALCVSWDPAADAGARLFGLLARKGTTSVAVGAERVAGERAVVDLALGAGRVGIYLEQDGGWRIAAVRDVPAWEEQFLGGQLDAQLALEDLPVAHAGQLSRATSWIDRLLMTNGGLDDAPFLLRARLKSGATIEPVPTRSHRLGERFAACFTVVDEGRRQDRWFLFDDRGFLRLTTLLSPVDLVRETTPPRG